MRGWFELRFGCPAINRYMRINFVQMQSASSAIIDYCEHRAEWSLHNVRHRLPSCHSSTVVRNSYQKHKIFSQNSHQRPKFAPKQNSWCATLQPTIWKYWQRNKACSAQSSSLLKTVSTRYRESSPSTTPWEEANSAGINTFYHQKISLLSTKSCGRS